MEISDDSAVQNGLAHLKFKTVRPNECAQHDTLVMPLKCSKPCAAVYRTPAPDPWAAVGTVLFRTTSFSAADEFRPARSDSRSKSDSRWRSLRHVANTIIDWRIVRANGKADDHASRRTFSSGHFQRMPSHLSPYRRLYCQQAPYLVGFKDGRSVAVSLA